MWDLWWTKRHGAGFLIILLFPLTNFSLIALHSTSFIIIRSWYSRPIMASVIVPLHPMKGEKKGKGYFFYYSTLKVVCSS
jgi:hypothetical protein